MLAFHVALGQGEPQVRVVNDEAPSFLYSHLESTMSDNPSGSVEPFTKVRTLPVATLHDAGLQDILAVGSELAGVVPLTERVLLFEQ